MTDYLAKQFEILLATIKSWEHSAPVQIALIQEQVEQLEKHTVDAVKWANDANAARDAALAKVAALEAMRSAPILPRIDFGGNEICDVCGSREHSACGLE